MIDLKELKQKAKKWVKDNTRIEHSASFGKIEVEPSAEKGYIAGATENGIKWHDLRKDPNDLPKYDVLGDDVSITVLNQNGNKVFYNFIKKLWKLERNNKVSKVTAWCKIPQFKE